ncbi:MAG TPA: hypothetical protein VNJ07_02675 [Chitinophagales bacterium]|nr:hypothetical protein [Chitinophagales bacterium]
MKYFLSLLVILCAAAYTSFAQYDYEDDDLKKKPKPPKEDRRAGRDDGKGFDLSRMSVGGMFNFSYGGGYFDGVTEYSNILYLDISPIVTYQLIEDRLDIGGGVIYQFQRYDAVTIFGTRYENKSHTYGGRMFPRVYIFEGLFAQLEYVIWNGDVVLVDQLGYILDKARMTFHNAFAGAGYKFPIGGSAYFTLLGSVNLNTNLLYPKRQFFLSFGFGMGL